MSRLQFDDVEVTKDGLTYIIERTHFGQEITMLLRSDPDGWHMQDVGGNVSHRLGRRKSWIDALRDALVWIDAHLKASSGQAEETVGERLQRHAKATHGWNRFTLAIRIGVSVETLKSWTSGETSPNRRRAQAAADALGVSVEWVLHGREAT